MSDPSPEDLFRSVGETLEWAYKMVEEAILAERERCAKLAEEWFPPEDDAADQLVDLIRKDPS